MRSEGQLYSKGTRFLQQKRPVEYFAQGTIHAFGWVAREVGPLGGAAMDVPENYVDVPVVHVYTVNVTDSLTNVTTEVNVTNTTVVCTYVVPLKDRCVVDGLDQSALFTVGDRESPDCRWPQRKAKRFQPSQGGAVGDAEVEMQHSWGGDQNAWQRTDAAEEPEDREGSAEIPKRSAGDGPVRSSEVEAGGERLEVAW